MLIKAFTKHILTAVQLHMRESEQEGVRGRQWRTLIVFCCLLLLYSDCQKIKLKTVTIKGVFFFLSFILSAYMEINIRHQICL